MPVFSWRDESHFTTSFMKSPVAAVTYAQEPRGEVKGPAVSPWAPSLRESLFCAL